MLSHHPSFSPLVSVSNLLRLLVEMKTTWSGKILNNQWKVSLSDYPGTKWELGLVNTLLLPPPPSAFALAAFTRQKSIPRKYNLISPWSASLNSLHWIKSVKTEIDLSVGHLTAAPRTTRPIIITDPWEKLTHRRGQELILCVGVCVCPSDTNLPEIKRDIALLVCNMFYEQSQQSLSGI